MSYAEQQTAGSTLASYGASNNPTRQPRLDQVSDRFEKSLNEFLTLTQRLQNITDRVLGPVPEAVENNKQPQPPSASIGKLESMTESLGQLLRRLNQSVERLETL
jgi:hypothetical protein